MSDKTNAVRKCESAGRIGLQISVAVVDLSKVVAFDVAEITSNSL